MHTPLQMPQKLSTFGNRMKSIFKSNPSKHGQPPEISPKVQEKPLLVEVSNRGDDVKRTKAPKTSPKAGEKSIVAEPLAVSKSESTADTSPEQYSQIEQIRAQQRDEVQLENGHLQSQCTRLFDQLQQENKEKGELEEQNRETCSRLEQQRDEAIRMTVELTASSTVGGTPL